jgi:hypothetical protein
MTKNIISDLLHKLAMGGQATTEAEKLVLNSLANCLNQSPPKYACPICWLKRQLKETAQKVGV